MTGVDLSGFDNSWYNPGRSRTVQALWFLVGLPTLRCPLLPSSRIRKFLLLLFGAKIGTGVVLKPGIRVKYPWLLRIGDHSWVGEDCWIDNLAVVSVGNNVCVSQGAFLCTGNHDWSDPRFALIVKPITLEDGAWVGAKAFIGPGVEIGRCAIATSGSVVTKSIPAGEIHAGNPAVRTRLRILSGAQ
jgi:putative colanic acid biosynthesis acetyltransferase WcaF